MQDRALRKVITVLLILGIVGGGAIGISWYVQTRYAHTLTSAYHYEVSLETATDLSNVTFFIPLPTGPDGTSPVVKAVGSMGEDLPAGAWDLLGDRDFAMLRYTAPALPPNRRPAPVPMHPENGTPAQSKGGEIIVPWTVTIRARTDGVIETRNPGVLLRPRSGPAKVPCPMPASSGTVSECREYTGFMYARYDAPSNASVDITVEVTGSNHWFILGWSGNEYRDRQSLHLTGPVRGWHETDGFVSTGIGRYSVI